MKRHGNLFAKIFTRENLYQAYLDARRGKRTKRACFAFEINLGGELDALFWEIHSGLYRPQPYRTFWVREPKPRLIHAPHFRDRVVQHAIYRVVYPIFNRTFVSTSFACRIGYGTHKASAYTQQALRACDPDSYTLKLDIRKFFYSIDRNILRLLVEAKIKDWRLTEIMLRFADSDGPVGIPIGNLLSQLYALIYLNPLDHYIKRALKIEHYVRYVDDFILFNLTRQQCLDLRQRLVEFLADNLRLELSKSTIQKVKHGVNFVGYRTWQHRRLIRKHSLYKFRRRAKQGNARAVASLLGHAKGTASLPHMVTHIKEIPHEGLLLPKNVRRLHGLPGAGHRGSTAARAVHD
jgi:retron-type reverse transcriptase